MKREEAIRWLTQDYCCNRAVCELYSQNLCQTENCEIWVAKKALEEPERKAGKWIPVTNGRGGNECNVCHRYAPSYQSGEEHLSDFCPNCGADMRGESDVES